MYLYTSSLLFARLSISLLSICTSLCLPPLSLCTSLSLSPSSLYVLLSLLLLLLLLLLSLSLSLQMDEAVWHFDAELCLLRHEKLTLDIQMKMVDLHHVTLFQELLLLEFDQRESPLQERLNASMKEEDQLVVGGMILFQKVLMF